MRTASILIALIVVLGLHREARAESWNCYPDHDYTVCIWESCFGFFDGTEFESGEATAVSVVYLGPLGRHYVPFTATQGLIGSMLILAALVIAPIVVLVTWRRKRVAV